MVRDLARGMTGEDVRNMQGMLNLHLALKVSPKLETDGRFGSATDTRVRDFQARNRLKVDGIVGNDTRRALLDFRRVNGQGVGSPSGSLLASRRNVGVALAKRTGAAVWYAHHAECAALVVSFHSENVQG